MADIERVAEAIWAGDLRNGEGTIDTESGALREESYSYGTRFENTPGTNPEELIAAAHAACYSMAFAGTLREKGYNPERIETHATVTVSSQRGGGFKITRSRLQVRGRVPDIDGQTFREIAEEADGGCPVSNLLRSGLTIELDAALL